MGFVVWRRLRLVVAVVGLVGLGATAGFASTTFTDVDEGRYYTDAVQWAADNGVTTGTSATTFSPENAVTRGQNVTFAYRYDQNVVQPALNNIDDRFDGLETLDELSCGATQVVINDSGWRCADPVLKPSFRAAINYTPVSASGYSWYALWASGLGEEGVQVLAVDSRGEDSSPVRIERWSVLKRYGERECGRAWERGSPRATASARGSCPGSVPAEARGGGVSPRCVPRLIESERPQAVCLSRPPVGLQGLPGLSRPFEHRQDPRFRGPAVRARFPEGRAGGGHERARPKLGVGVREDRAQALGEVALRQRRAGGAETQPELGEEDVALGFERPETLGAALGEGAQGVRDGGLRVSALSARRGHQQEGPQGLELEARGVAPREEPSRGRRGVHSPRRGHRPPVPRGAGPRLRDDEARRLTYSTITHV